MADYLSGFNISTGEKIPHGSIPEWKVLDISGKISIIEDYFLRNYGSPKELNTRREGVFYNQQCFKQFMDDCDFPPFASIRQTIDDCVMRDGTVGLHSFVNQLSRKPVNLKRVIDYCQNQRDYK
jgi:hypothetical protein